jgi:hypothetical protein
MFGTYENNTRKRGYACLEPMKITPSLKCITRA